MKRKTWIIGSAAGAALAAVLAWAFAPRPLAVEVGSAALGRFEASIAEDGITRLRDTYRVTAPLAGLLRRIALREGDPVAAGAALATIEPALAPMQDARTLREQRERVELAAAHAGRADARIAQAQVALARARDELARSEQLARQGFVAESKLSADRLALQAGQRELDMARAERHIADHEVALARAALLAVRAGDGGAGRAFTLRAPIAGRVLRLHQTSETFATPGMPLMELGEPADSEVVAEVLTADAAQARPGSPVLIDRWGGPPLQGRVRLVEPAAFTKISVLGVEEQRVKVVIDITSPPAQWRNLGIGYRVGVRIVTLAVDKALLAPVSAVFPLPKGGMAVFVVEQGHARLRPVRIGARNDSAAWISEGLAPGARVIVYPPAELRDGVRVQVREA